jgi:thioredoxin-like negative regulator of GroEL
LIFRDRPYSRRDNYHYEHTYVDRYSRIRRKLIWPKYRYIVRYNRGPRFSYRYFYPYYHRKYVFVSLGGYWPLRYSYIRYHWYGCHPHYWYGYYPIAREVQTGTQNYYTYNYYYDNDNQGYASTQIDSDYFDNLDQQQAEPAQATLADSYFDEAVKAFEDENYGIAINKFAKAMELAPDDMILPFAYCQALLAAERYSEAAQVLRTSLKKVDPEKEGVFFPRGLYQKEEILLEQLDRLAVKAEVYSFDADLQLLLGYQLLGIGELDKAVTPLINASMDLNNNEAAAVLIKLLEEIKTTEEEKQETNTEKVQTNEDEMSSFIPSQGTRQIAEIQSQHVQGNIVNEKHATKIKETVLVATLCVLAGSTGIGHYIRT